MTRRDLFTAAYCATTCGAAGAFFGWLADAAALGAALGAIVGLWVAWEIHESRRRWADVEACNREQYRRLSGIGSEDEQP